MTTTGRVPKVHGVRPWDAMDAAMLRDADKFYRAAERAARRDERELYAALRTQYEALLAQRNARTAAQIAGGAR